MLDIRSPHDDWERLGHLLELEEVYPDPITEEEYATEQRWQDLYNANWWMYEDTATFEEVV